MIGFFLLLTRFFMRQNDFNASEVTFFSKSRWKSEYWVLLGRAFMFTSRLFRGQNEPYLFFHTSKYFWNYLRLCDYFLRVIRKRPWYNPSSPFLGAIMVSNCSNCPLYLPEILSWKELFIFTLSLWVVSEYFFAISAEISMPNNWSRAWRNASKRHSWILYLQFLVSLKQSFVLI